MQQSSIFSERIVGILYIGIISLCTNKLLEWNIFFESLWPRSAKKISIIQSNMIRHKALMNSEVTLENILQAYNSRERACMEYDRMRDFQDGQNFETVRAAIAPHLYDDDLEAFRRECESKSGQWLEEEKNFKRWSDPSDHSVRRFWLQGMPGAGTSFAFHNLNIKITHKKGRRSQPLSLSVAKEQLVIMSYSHSPGTISLHTTMP